MNQGEILKLLRSDEKGVPYSRLRGEAPVVGEDSTGAPIRGLEGVTAPLREMTYEKYTDRLMAYMKMEGRTNVEIAQVMRCSAATVNTRLKQPWVERFILEETQKRGGDKVEAMLRDTAPEATTRLKEILNDSDSSNKDVIAAANSILDRAGYCRSSDIRVKSDIDTTNMSDAQLIAFLTGTSRPGTSEASSS